MVNNKTLVLKEAELIDFISSTVMGLINEGKETQSQKLEILKTYIADDVGDEFLLTNMKPQVDKAVQEICAPCAEITNKLEEQLFQKKGTITKYVEVVGCTNPRADNYDPDANVDDGSCVVTKGNSDYTISTLHPLDKQAGRTQSCMRCHQFTSPFGRTPNASELMWLNQPGFDFDRISWQTIEYAADAIGVIALFFGPVGWIVSGVAGLVSAYASYEQGNKGTAALTLGLEIIPGFKLFKHFKHLNKFKRVSPDEIGKAFKYFEDPGEAAYKVLTKDSKAIVNYAMKNKDIIAPLLKYSDEAIKARDVIANIKTIDKFVKYAITPAGIKHGINKLSWIDFQKMQKSLKTSEKIIIKVKNGIKVATPYVVGVIPAIYGIQWAMYGANAWIFHGVINDTDDLITSAKLDDIYHYRYDRVLNQKYPYNRGFNKALCKTPDKYEFCKYWDGEEIGLDEDYTDAFKSSLPGGPPNILLLIKLWRDSERFPEIIPGDSCVGVNLGEVANPGGGWRPNLNCLKGYNLNRQLGEIQAEGEELINSMTELIEQIKEGKIKEAEARREMGIDLNLNQVEYDRIDFSDVDSTNIEYL